MNSLESNDDKREDKKDKKDSRTSRLFKRMSSSISAASRKGMSQAISPTVKEEDYEAGLPSFREPPPAVQVGDLNVQFPDTLVSYVASYVCSQLLTMTSSGNEDGSRLMEWGISF